jgi:hypothetical protein
VEKNNEGSLAMVTEDKVSPSPQNCPNSLDLQFVPRKRTNTNRVITPKKSMRQTPLNFLAQRVPCGEHTSGNLNSPRRRKSSRKGLRRNADKIALGVRAGSQLLEDVSRSKENDNEILLVNELEVDVVVTEKENLHRSTGGSRASSVDIQEGFDTVLIVSNETLTKTSLNTTSKMVKFFSPQDVIDNATTEMDPNEPSYISHHETATFTTSDETSISQYEEPKMNGPDSTSNKSVSLESGDLSSPSTSCSDICAGKSIQGTSMGEIANGPATIIIQDDQPKTELDATLAMGDSVILTPDQVHLLRDGLTIEQTTIVKPSEDHATAARVDGSPAVNECDTNAATLQSEVYGTPNELEELRVPEKKTNDTEELEILDLKRNELADTTSTNAPTIYDHDHDDTDMLRNFLTRVKANKAAKAPTKRKRSLPHSPLRIPLGEMDGNLSPSPIKPADGFDLIQSPSSPKRGPPEEVPEAKSCRRSGRTRLPTKAIPGVPSFIPVRRLGQEAETTVALKRNEEKEIAALTRVNTRKNKGAALTAAEVLAKKSEEKEDPVMRQRLLKEVFNERKGKDKHGSERKGTGKNVTWAEELAQFQTLDKSRLEPSKSDKEEKTGQVEEEKKQGAVRVSVRSKMALGMAVNGTPAPKRRIRGRA